MSEFITITRRAENIVYEMFRGNYAYPSADAFIITPAQAVRALKGKRMVFVYAYTGDQVHVATYRLEPAAVLMPVERPNNFYNEIRMLMIKKSLICLEKK